MRVDYNVPMEEKYGQMVINDVTRIKETLPTLELLVKKGAKIILTAHLGRPDGKRESSMSLKPVAAKLSDMLGAPVAFLVRQSRASRFPDGISRPRCLEKASRQPY